MSQDADTSTKDVNFHSIFTSHVLCLEILPVHKSAAKRKKPGEKRMSWEHPALSAHRTVLLRGREAEFQRVK